MAGCEVSIHLQALKQESLYTNTSLSHSVDSELIIWITAVLFFKTPHYITF